MSRDWRPFEKYLYDLQMDKQTRGEMTFTTADGESFRIDNHLAKERYPELSFLYGPFDTLYSKYENSETALAFLDGIEETLKACEAEITEKMAAAQAQSPHHDTIKAWFMGELDTCFYYREDNDRLLWEYLTMEIATASKTFQLLDTDTEYHIEADIPRTDERRYSYQIGTIGKEPLFVDMYAGRNKNGEFTVHNLDEGYAYTIENDDEEYFKLPDKLTVLLEEDALQRLKDELGLADPPKTKPTTKERE